MKMLFKKNLAMQEFYELPQNKHKNSGGVSKLEMGTCLMGFAISNRISRLGGKAQMGQEPSVPGE